MIFTESVRERAAEALRAASPPRLQLFSVARTRQDPLPRAGCRALQPWAGGAVTGRPGAWRSASGAAEHGRVCRGGSRWGPAFRGAPPPSPLHRNFPEGPSERGASRRSPDIGVGGCDKRRAAHDLHVCVTAEQGR